MAWVKNNVVCLFGGVSSHELSIELGGKKNYLSDFYFLNISNNFKQIKLTFK